MKKISIVLSVMSIILPLSVLARADVYPSKPVEIIVPYAAGGGVDVNARILAEHTKKYFGQPLIVVNRTGGGGVIGISAGAQARPDGYSTILLTNAALTDEFLTKGAPYTYKNFSPILQVAFDPVVLVVLKGGAYDRPLKEFLDQVRKNPEKIRIGGANWSASDFNRALLEGEEKVKFAVVPFTGNAQALVALLGGHIDVSNAYIAEIRGYYDSKRVQPLAITGEQRSPFLPEIPTFKELGIPLSNVGVWRIMAAPAKTPPSIIKTLETAFRKTMEDPAALEAFKKAGINVIVRDSKDAQQYLDGQYNFYSKTIKEIGLEPK